MWFRFLGKLKSGPVRAARILVTGSVLASAIPLALTPVLTRIFTPEEFGLLAILVAVGTVLGAAANARYELAVMIAEDEEEAVQVTILGLLVAATLSFASLIVVAAWGRQFGELLGRPDIRFWLYLVPLMGFGVGLLNSLNMLNNRLQNYRAIARANIVKSLVTGALQVGGGAAFAGPAGLLVGQAANSVAGNSILIPGVLPVLKRHASFDPQRLLWVARRYADFPRYSLPANLANTATTHATNLFVSGIFSVASLGQLALVQRALASPTVLVGNSVGQVFYREAVSERKRTGAAIKAFDSTVLPLAIISVPCFVLVFFFAPAIFEVVFGAEWRAAGEYARALTPLFAIRFIMSAVSQAPSVFEKQRLSFLWQAALLVLAICTAIAALVFGWSVVQFLWVHSLVLTGHYCLLYLLLRNLSKG